MLLGVMSVTHVIGRPIYLFYRLDVGGGEGIAKLECCYLANRIKSERILGYHSEIAEYSHEMSKCFRATLKYIIYIQGFP